MEAFTAVVLCCLTSLFLMVFVGIPILAATGVWIPMAVLGGLAAFFLFIEMFMFVLDMS